VSTIPPVVPMERSNTAVGGLTGDSDQERSRWGVDSCSLMFFFYLKLSGMVLLATGLLQIDRAGQVSDRLDSTLDGVVFNG
jgi:hypothetical protein